MSSPDRANLVAALRDCELKDFYPEIILLLDEKYKNPKHGHFNEWNEVFESLDELCASITDFNQNAVVIGSASDITQQERDLLNQKLQTLQPWRKGPFNIFDIYIDTEWRSDWKWSRIASHIDLNDKLVLDVGCGNGYYALRMQGLGAKLVIGIDPSWHYFFQFQCMQKYSCLPQRAFVLPFTLEEFPPTINSFDRIFSMGVLYHRREPVQHLEKIYSLLKDDGQFILETLIIENAETNMLIPDERYANMRNVWMIPSMDQLKKWVVDAGFAEINVIDISTTTMQEQRQTEWMRRYSLAQALDPNDVNMTIEGYPAPTRATLIANKKA